MKKFAIQLSFLLIVIFGALLLFSNPQFLGSIIPLPQTFEAKQIKIGNAVINVEVADTASERSKGLGGRDKLDPSSGMLFIFPEEKKYRFWMKGMRFPLDFIFIREGRVVDLLNNIPPPLADQKDTTLPVYEPVVPINMMLEVNAGIIDKYNIHIGDQVLLVSSE